VSKETCYSVKRDLLQCQKRPTTVSKEVDTEGVKGRDQNVQPQVELGSVDQERFVYVLTCSKVQCQKRPDTVSKETCSSVKRDLI
jgi:hypothetical protein